MTDGEAPTGAWDEGPFRLPNRTALVTGAGRGVGEGIARALAAAGAAVAVNDLHPDRADRVVAEIAAAGGRASAVPFDVTDAEGLAVALERIRETFGGVDILVHNAGIPDGGSTMVRFGDMPSEAWRQQIELNLVATMRLVQAVLPHQVARGWGRIIHISSGASSRGLALGVGAYGAAKAGSEALMRHLGVEYGPVGITANSLALGIMTGLEDSGSGLLQRLVQSVPIRRLGTGADVGAAAVWLSSAAGGFVNSQVIHLNGGTVFGR
ncbi:3-oxoacyl-[acyl-carrier protein] reductase [Blastococcus sp. DSM 46786]|uniref:SDR family NAD(P)-dependent oxidoreductase n=1 Tax=Blastococcus sp. DSM 46786 TaxID=1798227 RepID=UPI0008CF3369|nr:SDR family NAD(P)-dependent oxidoreductase [Blastococcus sp. DSM 46786]SEK71415.1 3-oxoacyl-[acyl-carrier protein] reductase [Blastococcus sp. DSM 46786]